MQVRYIGDPLGKGDDPETITEGGVTFKKGRWQDVPEDMDPERRRKLAGNPTFETKGGEDGLAQNGPAPVEPPEPAAQSLRSDGLTVAELKAELDELKIEYPSNANKAELALLLDSYEPPADQA